MTRHLNREEFGKSLRQFFSVDGSVNQPAKPFVSSQVTRDWPGVTWPEFQKWSWLRSGPEGHYWQEGYEGKERARRGGGGISGRRGRGEGLGHSRGGRRSFDGGHKGKWGYKLPFPGRQVNRHTWRPPPPSQTLRTAFLTSNHLTPPHPSLPSLTLPVYF